MLILARPQSWKFLCYICVIFTALASLGCSRTAQTTPFVSPSDSPVRSDSPIPTATLPIINVVPTPEDPEMGVVAGQLVQYIAEEEVGPSVGVRLFLAEILMGEDGTAPMAALDEAEAPQVTTGEHGEFVFLDVPPGMYALIIKTPISAMLAHDVVDEEDVVVEVSAGEAVDMGPVRVELPF